MNNLQTLLKEKIQYFNKGKGRKTGNKTAMGKKN